MAGAGLLAGAAAMVLFSESFAYTVSRVVEAAFESVEVRLDRRSRARYAAEQRDTGADQSGADRVVVVRARPVSPQAPYARAGVTGPLRAS
jgi:hypothetical protein